MPRRIRPLLLALLALPLAALTAPLFARFGGANVESIYGDSLGAKWVTYTWDCGGLRTNLAARPAGANGTALEVDHSACGGGWGAFGVDRRTASWWPMYYMDPATFKAYTFRFNAGADPSQIRALYVQLNLDAGGNVEQPLTKYLPATLAPNTWYDVRIPVAELMAAPVQFTRLLFFNKGAQKPHYYLDDVGVEWIGAVVTPVISNATVAERTPSSARLTWATDLAARGTLTVTGGGTTKTVAETAFTKAHSLSVTGLAPGTAYTYTITARPQEGTDPVGEASVTGSFTTPALDVTPPTFAGVKVTATTTTTATITWTTDEPADTRVEFGTMDYSLSASDAARTTSHSVTLTALTPGTTYRFRLRGTDANGNTGTYSPLPTPTFTTTRAEESPEVAYESVYADALGTKWLADKWDCGGLAYNLSARDAGGANRIIEVDHSACAGGWGAFGFDRRNAAWDKYYMQLNQYRAFVFRFNPGADVSQVDALKLFLDLPASEGTNTEQPLTNYLPNTLTPNTWYTVRVPVADLMAAPTRFFRLYFFNMGARKPHYFLDDVQVEYVSRVPAPVISNVRPTATAQDAVTLAWATDAPARGTLTVDVGGTPRTISEMAYTAAHSTAVDGLQPSTTYRFTITAAAQSDDPAQTPLEGRYEGTFTTAAPDVTGPVITNVVVRPFATRAEITWTTDEPADARAEYGTSAYDRTATDAARTTSHTLTLSGLAPGTRYGFRLQGTDRFGNTGTYAPTPAATFTTAAIPTATLAVNAAQPTRPFRDAMRGVGFGNWASMYGRPYPGDSPRARELTRLIRPGLFRYSGGLASNMIAWDRTNAQPYPGGMIDTDGDGTGDTWNMRKDHDPYLSGTDYCAGSAPFTKPNAYRWTYQGEEVDRLAAFAGYVGADVMIETDVTTCDPAMWADMVRYANVEKGYGFKYWEIGNELDLVKNTTDETDVPVGAEYVRRYKLYNDAMKAVDPSVVLTGPTVASSVLDNNWFYSRRDFIDPITTAPDAASMLGAYSFHYYPLWRSYSSQVSFNDMASYNHPTTWERSRAYAIPMVQEHRALLDARGLQHVPILITEYHSIAADVQTNFVPNHASALYLADGLGRLATGGADGTALWILTDTPSISSYGMLPHEESRVLRATNGAISVQDNYTITPTYYTYFMYGQLFGDQLVQSSSTAQDKLSIWASTDRRNPGAVKLMITNFSDEAIQATVNVSGTTVTDAKAYELTNPGFVAATNKEAAIDPSNVNGIAIDPTSPATILQSARQILASGRPVAASGNALTHTFGPYSVTAIIINQPTPNAIADVPALAPPTMRAPVLTTDKPTLSWQGVAGALSYRVQVSASPTFATTVLDRAYVTDAHLALTGLQPGTTYYARVASRDVTTTSPWGAVQTFTTGGTVAAARTLSAEAGPGRVALAWTGEAAAQGFEVQQLDGTRYAPVGYVPATDALPPSATAELAPADAHASTGTAQSPASTYRFTLANLKPGTYHFRLRQRNSDGTYFDAAEAEVVVPLGVPYEVEAPRPNPFGARATIGLMVAEAQRVRAEVYDLTGRRVAVLLDGPLDANRQTALTIEGTDLAAGVYVVRITGEHFTTTERIVRQ